MEIVNIISNVGFPIAMVLVLIWFVKYVFDQYTSTLLTVKDTLLLVKDTVDELKAMMLLIKENIKNEC